MTSYPTIANCNYESADDDTIHRARLAAEGTTMAKTTDRYYHAGCGTDGNIRWSDHTRRTRAAAEREARAMARKHGGRGVVEYWDARHGLRPGDQEVVEGADWVA